ncbi:MAG: DUF3426 domain-containing protein [Desulfonatronovibrio sp.]
MIVQCPNCSTKYNFDESKFKDEVKVRCTKCEHVFKLSTLNDDDDDFFDDFSLGDKKDSAPKNAPEEPQWDPDDMNVDIAPSSDPEGDRRKKIRAIAIGLTALVSLILIVVFVVPNMGNNLDIPFITPEQEDEDEPKQTEFTEEDVKDITLDNIRQYFVSNDKIGQLFVIEGQAVNNFEQPKSMIKLRASLYDASGNVIIEKDFLCGNVASLFQLQVSSEEELESTLEARLGILTTNKHVDPGSHTPFMAVFYNPPEEVQEFGLEVIEAHDPV